MMSTGTTTRTTAFLITQDDDARIIIILRLFFGFIRLMGVCWFWDGLHWRTRGGFRKGRLGIDIGPMASRGATMLMLTQTVSKPGYGSWIDWVNYFIFTDRGANFHWHAGRPFQIFSVPTCTGSARQQQEQQQQQRVA